MRSANIQGNTERDPLATDLGRNITSARQKPKITPEMKAWLDHVLIPAMVRLYLAGSGANEDNGMNLISERVQ
jgi:hypothetical protein